MAYNQLARPSTSEVAVQATVSTGEMGVETEPVIDSPTYIALIRVMETFHLSQYNIIF